MRVRHLPPPGFLRHAPSRCHCKCPRIFISSGFFMVRLQTVRHKNLLFRYSMGMKDVGSPEPRWTGSNIFPAYFVFSSSPLSLSKRSHRDPSRRDFFIPTPHPVPNNSPSQNASPRPSPPPPYQAGSTKQPVAQRVLRVWPTGACCKARSKSRRPEGGPG